MTLRSVILASLAAFALGACAPTGVSGTAYYSAPSMAYVSPGVSVVADYDYPVFYSDSYYWRYDGGYWYRSPYYNRGWVTASHVPYAVTRIDRPWVYTHYNVRDRGYYQPAYRGTVRGSYTVRPVPRGMRVPVRSMGRDHRRH